MKLGKVKKLKFLSFKKKLNINLTISSYKHNSDQYLQNQKLFFPRQGPTHKEGDNIQNLRDIFETKTLELKK